MNPPATEPAVERYLDRVRVFLRGLPQPESDEIVLELRGHIAERLAVDRDVERVLRSLGDPAELARQYRADRVTTRAECGWSPIVTLHSLLLLRRGRLAGWVVLLVAALGYAWALALAGAAIEKVLSPHDVGLWYRPGRAPRITVDGPGPSGTHELLGWWFVPVGLVAGAALLLVTRQFALWWIRRSRGTAGSSSIAR